MLLLNLQTQNCGLIRMPKTVGAHSNLKRTTCPQTSNSSLNAKLFQVHSRKTPSSHHLRLDLEKDPKQSPNAISQLASVHSVSCSSSLLGSGSKRTRRPRSCRSAASAPGGWLRGNSVSKFWMASMAGASRAADRAESAEMSPQH
jgi:hypothetical protein